jgi:hypothetical protein
VLTTEAHRILFGKLKKKITQPELPRKTLSQTPHQTNLTKRAKYQQGGNI